jgi:two-component system sensor histidine kinase QseC
MQKITPCLWFDTQGEEAVNFYLSIFKDAKVTDVLRYGEGAPRPKGSVLTMTFEIEGQSFMVLNGGPEYTFNPAISLAVSCKTQEEVDYYWERLLEGGSPVQCGWLTDKFGVSWQIVPTPLIEMLKDADKAKAQRVMEAMMKMIKIDIPTLQKAYDGR